ncbi:hypothetical protein JCM9157_4433 [Halalkalibacter akibai JCM 9157]|uniref:Uncharacterized protein n=2 Tax=Halalkalibacter akibai TaxID=1411 RepID=W4QYL5_HALA3|nr:hypothetical protein JCM9157_4433 [Halalkalibacter akibai JCM 9157]
MKLFFQSETEGTYLAMRTLEFYIDEMDMLKDLESVAFEVEHQKAYALLPKFKLIDSKSVDVLEEMLRG